MSVLFFRSIIHLDADAFFASVEQASDVRLRGKPVAVGGEKRGIIASASYEARKFGIYTPMPTVLARRLCPKLILLPADFEKYELFSRLMFSYAYDFTPDVEIGSIDEGYFDLTGARQSPLSIADTIRRAIVQSLRLPVSEGIGSNKLVSQIASKLKKPQAFHFVPPGQEAGFLSPLANQWLPGVGPKTATQLNAAGLARIGQIAGTPADLLGLLVGSLAVQLKRFALGLDDRPVVPARHPAKSYSEQETFAADTTDEVFLGAVLRRMADQLMAKVRADRKGIRTVTVKVRYNDMDEEQAGESLAEPTDLETEIYPKLDALLRKAWKRRVSLRLVSLKFANVYEGPFHGELRLEPRAVRHDAEERLSGIVDQLRRKFGRGVILRGHDLILRARNHSGQEPAPPAASEACGDSLHEAPPAYPRPGGPRLHPGSAFALRPSAASPLASDIAKASLTPRFQRRPRVAEVNAIPLQVHSYYSFLDSTLSLRAIVDWAKRHELPAVALTDRHNLHGAVEFAQTAAAAGIQPIIGAEIRWQGHPLCLYVQNVEGYGNLCRLLAAPAAESDRRLAHRDLPDATRGSPAGGPTAFSDAVALPEQTAGLLAVSPAAELAPFFPGRFYLAVHDPKALERCAGRIPAVASWPVHYELPADRWKYDVIQSIRTLTLLRQPHPDKRLDGAFHFPDLRELRRRFAAHPEVIAYTHEVADRCPFQFSLGKPQFPGFTPPDGLSPAAFLRRLVLDGLRRRYPRDHDRLRPQLEEELAIITEVGYEEYFLVMWDILQECRQRGIEWITRGSAADSLACYCLGISGVCPIRFDLYFRRFLNKERMALNKLPDIDVDFPHDRKDDVVDLVFEKYGPEHAAVVGGFSTFQARSAFAEIAKVLGVSEYQVRRLTERLPHFSRAGDLPEAVAASQECRDLPLTEEPYATALQMACFLDGFPRYPKMHPCGVVLSRQPMLELVPTFRSAKGYPTTHFDMDSVEAIGLVKMDLLAQGGLAVMRDVRNDLRERRGIELDYDRLEPWQDARVWTLIASGNARAVHHIESPAMISLCRMCNVRDIDTLVAIVSVIRPGAANESKKMEFARRYQGLSPVRYPHPSLERCLRGTFGLVVYEEHILQMCEAFAGLPPGRADVLRRALAKEKNEVIAQIGAEFAQCARARGRTEPEIAEVWGLVTGFKGYAFCKAHSTAYGVEAYQSAWLKCYYPAEFMAAVLTNGKGFYNPLVYILECHRLGIALRPPTINEPGPAFTVADGTIRVPAVRVKGLTERTTQRLLQERERAPFSSLADFFLRVHPLSEEMQALIQIGAFDEFGTSRTGQFWELKSLAHAAGHPPPSAGALPSAGQLWLLPPADLARLPGAVLTEPDRLQRLRWEEELLGYCVSGHPLELYPDIAWNTYCPVNRLGDHVGQAVVTCGLVVEQRMFHQITGEPMKFITIADRTGMIETELFARTYKSYGLNTVRYRVLELEAMVEPFENGRGHTLRVLRAGKPRSGPSGTRAGGAC